MVGAAKKSGKIEGLFHHIFFKSKSKYTVSKEVELKKGKDPGKVLAAVKSFLLLLALSIHSLFEGMALGGNTDVRF